MTRVGLHEHFIWRMRHNLRLEICICVDCAGPHVQSCIQFHDRSLLLLTRIWIVLVACWEHSRLSQRTRTKIVSAAYSQCFQYSISTRIKIVLVACQECLQCSWSTRIKMWHARMFLLLVLYPYQNHIRCMLDNFGADCRPVSESYSWHWH